MVPYAIDVLDHWAHAQGSLGSPVVPEGSLGTLGSPGMLTIGIAVAFIVIGVPLSYLFMMNRYRQPISIE